MATIHRVRVGLSGFPGGPGVATFYALDGPAFLPALEVFLEGIVGVFPTDVTLRAESSGDVLNDVNGEITGSWSGMATDPHVGTHADVYAAPAGMLIHWLTGTVLDGRRLRGRTFLVPASSAVFHTDGTVTSGTLTSVQDLGAGLVADAEGNFVVWHRPREARAADGSRPAVTHRDGGHAFVTASSVPDRIVVLRSRRD